MADKKKKEVETLPARRYLFQLRPFELSDVARARIARFKVYPSVKQVKP